MKLLEIVKIIKTGVIVHAECSFCDHVQLVNLADGEDLKNVECEICNNREE